MRESAYRRIDQSVDMLMSSAVVHAIGWTMHVTPAYDVTHVPLKADLAILDRSEVWGMLL